MPKVKKMISVFFLLFEFQGIEDFHRNAYRADIDLKNAQVDGRFKLGSAIKKVKRKN